MKKMNVFKKCGKKRHFSLGYRSFKACVKGKGIDKMDYTFGSISKDETDKCIEEVMNYIVQSEMEGSLDKNDSYYGTYMDLQDLLDKDV